MARLPLIVVAVLSALLASTTAFVPTATTPVAARSGKGFHFCLAVHSLVCLFVRRRQPGSDGGPYASCCRRRTTERG